MISVVAGQPKGLEQCFELQKDLVFAAPKDVGQDPACVVIDGMPEPAWIAFILDKRPHLIHLRSLFNFMKLLDFYDVHLDVIKRSCFQECKIYRL